MLKLAIGVAQLLHDGKWVDALTDEVARETARFTAWENIKRGDEVNARARTYKDRRLGNTILDSVLIGHFEDASGRKWRQHVHWRRGIMLPMIVKVELQIDAKAHVCMISNQDGSLRMTIMATTPLIARMLGKTKRFFDAEVSPTAIELGEWQVDQDW